MPKVTTAESCGYHLWEWKSAVNGDPRVRYLTVGFYPEAKMQCKTDGCTYDAHYIIIGHRWLQPADVTHTY